MRQPEEIIDAVDRKLIIGELTEETFLRHTNKGDNQLYIVNHKNAPNILREIGRLREETFRSAGGGTGKALDIDSYDLSDHPYEQLIVWDPEKQEITAGYRLLFCKEAGKDSENNIASATACLFELSETFYKDFLSYALELGRSFVQPKYQRSLKNRKSLFALDNLWDGLGVLIAKKPDLKYMFGKVTMYPNYNIEARNLILAFMDCFFPDDIGLAKPHRPLVTKEELEVYKKHFRGMKYNPAHSLLNKMVRARGENIPPLINTYMNISSTMKTFGTAANYEFGEVEEIGILITTKDIYPSKKDRHSFTYDKDNKEFNGPLRK